MRRNPTAPYNAGVVAHRRGSAAQAPSQVAQVLVRARGAARTQWLPRRHPGLLVASSEKGGGRERLRRRGGVAAWRRSRLPCASASGFSSQRRWDWGATLLAARGQDSIRRGRQRLVRCARVRLRLRKCRCLIYRSTGQPRKPALVHPINKHPGTQGADECGVLCYLVLAAECCLGVAPVLYKLGTTTTQYWPTNVV